MLVRGGTAGALDSVPVSRIGQFETDFLAHLHANEKAVLDEIETKGELSKELMAKLDTITTDFVK